MRGASTSPHVGSRRSRGTHRGDPVDPQKSPPTRAATAMVVRGVTLRPPWKSPIVNLRTADAHVTPTATAEEIALFSNNERCQHFA